MWSSDAFEEGLCHVTLYGTVRFARRIRRKLRRANRTVQIPGFIDLWKLVAKHVVQLAVLERVTGCRFTEDSQICVLPEQRSSGPITHVIA